MPRYIVKTDGPYGEWSTIIDAPVSKLMNLDDFKAYYQHQYGVEGLSGLPERLKRVDEKGTSAIGDSSFEQTVNFNRAGDNEERLSVPDLIAAWKAMED